MRIVQIAPETDSVVGGIRASAQAVAEELRHGHGIESVFLSAAELRDEVARRTRAPAGRIVLHYANYGYAKRGCPWWLLRALDRWRRRGEVDRLLTVFHELYASGPPWTSAFWLRPAQRLLARRLARSSTDLVTSLGLYAQVLRGWTGRSDVLTLPVPSTVGEPAAPPPLARRSARLVVFGTAGTRRRTWDGHRRELEAACRALGVTEVLDIGTPGVRPPRTVADRPVTATGELPGTEVSRLLGDSRLGFLSYPPKMLEKSSVFATFAAHGVATLCAWPETRPGGLRPGVHFLDAASVAGPADAAALQAVASGAREWYLEHRVARQAELLAGRLTV